jgi:hypothetical protein
MAAPNIPNGLPLYELGSGMRPLSRPLPVTRASRRSQAVVASAVCQAAYSRPDSGQ